MTQDTSRWDQPVGPLVPGWQPRPRPPRRAMVGRYCLLEPLDASRHLDDLYRANANDDGRMWTYLPYGPAESKQAYSAWMADFCADQEVIPFAIVDPQGAGAQGVAAYQRVAPDDGTIEVGHLAFSPALQRSVLATEAMALMMRHVFDELGYRRYEWKCDALNEPSRRAAVRLGFTYEGTFRQAKVVRGRNRDTAWFAMTDGDWHRLRPAFETWLDEANFDASGVQHEALSALTARALSGDRAR